MQNNNNNSSEGKTSSDLENVSDDEMRKRERPVHVYVLAALGLAPAILYGIITRLIFGGHIFGNENESLGTLSISFFVFAPFVIGILTTLLMSEKFKRSPKHVILMPMIPCAICMVIAGIFAWEAWFCVALAFPIFLALASLGGLVGYLIWRLSKKIKSRFFSSSMAILFLMTPYMSAMVEQIAPAQTAVRTVHSQIQINRPASAVWPQITNLKPIQPAETKFAFFHFIGLPRPLDAQMTCQQVGCLRTGHWENGLAFEGTITKLVPEQMYWIALKAKTQAVQPSPAPLDQIGGAMFDMVDDGYVIETNPDGSSVLHLYSSYRVTSRINSYAAAWLDFLLQDIQRYILSVEKGRCEQTNQ